MKAWIYGGVLLATVTLSWAQVPLLLPTRNLAEELTLNTKLGWRGMFLMGTAYQPVEEAWLTDSFLPKFRLIVQRLRMRGDSPSFNCKDFSALFKSELALENHLAGNSVLGEVACAVLVVDQKHAFGRVLKNDEMLHSLVLVRTENGWRVIEPQTMRIASLEKYPNKDSIESAYF